MQLSVSKSVYDAWRTWSPCRPFGINLWPDYISSISKSIFKKVKDFRIDIKTFLAISTTGGFFTLIYMLIIRAAPVENEKVLYLLAGQVAAGWLTMIIYHYGSSEGSVRHSETIAKALESKKDKEQ